MRDDYFTFIHKALRYGMYQVTMDASALNWSSTEQVSAFGRRWKTIVELLAAHAKHEDDYIWPLLESKHPGSVAELDIGHEKIDAQLLALDAQFDRLAAGNGTNGDGLAFYLDLNRFLAVAMEHFAAEEPEVMNRLWDSCTDEELAACRQSFMATIQPPEAQATIELMLPALSPDERVAVLSSFRDRGQEEAYQSLLATAQRVLDQSAASDLVQSLEGTSVAH